MALAENPSVVWMPLINLVVHSFYVLITVNPDSELIPILTLFVYVSYVTWFSPYLAPGATATYSSSSTPSSTSLFSGISVDFKLIYNLKNS